VNWDYVDPEAITPSGLAEILADLNRRLDELGKPGHRLTCSEAPPAGRRVRDKDGDIWIVNRRGWSDPDDPTGFVYPTVSIVQLKGMDLIQPDVNTDGHLLWTDFLFRNGPAELVPLTDQEARDESLYGPYGARWGNPDVPCPYTLTVPSAGTWVTVQGAEIVASGATQSTYRHQCALGVGHAGPHRDRHDQVLGMTEPSGLSTTGRATELDLHTPCTCGRPDQHQPGCPRHARVAGVACDGTATCPIHPGRPAYQPWTMDPAPQPCPHCAKPWPLECDCTPGPQPGQIGVES